MLVGDRWPSHVRVGAVYGLRDGLKALRKAGWRTAGDLATIGVKHGTITIKDFRSRGDVLTAVVQTESGGWMECYARDFAEGPDQVYDLLGRAPHKEYDV